MSHTRARSGRTAGDTRGSALVWRIVGIDRWWLGWGLIALVLAEAPLVVAACCGPPELTGLGTFWFVNDFAQYESAIRQGAAGPSWLIVDQFTPEPHSAALMFTVYVALGKFSALFGLDPLALYRPAELFARLGLLLGAAKFLNVLLPARTERRIASIFLLFAMGLGVLAAIVGAILGFEAYTGNGSYEVNTFGLLFSSPHAALAMGITLWLASRVLRSEQPTSPRTGESPPADGVRGRAQDPPLRAFIAAIRSSSRRGGSCARPRRRQEHVDEPFATLRAWPTLLLMLAVGAALASLHAFHLPALFGGLGLYALARWLRQGDARPLVELTAVAVGALPILAYVMLVFGTDPFWAAAYSAQNLLPTPTPPQMVVEYGVVLLFAVPGLRIAFQRGGVWWGVLGWLLLVALASYLPVPYQRRLGFGLQPLLAVLAALGLVWAAARLGTRGGAWLRLGTVLLALMTTAIVFAGMLQSALAHQPLRPYRADRDSAAVIRALAGRVCPNDVILANWDLSNYIGGQVLARVTGGHPVATLDAVRRKAEFSAAGNDPERWRALVERFQPTYVLYGPAESGLPPPAKDAREISRQGHAVVYALGAGACE